MTNECSKPTQSKPTPADGELCGHSPEDFAEVQLKLEPRGYAWCKDYGTVKAAIYRACGKIFSDFEQRICDLFSESLACSSVELLNEWEIEYGLPKPCFQGSYPTDILTRQKLVCEARKGGGSKTLTEIVQILRDALECGFLDIVRDEFGQYCISGLREPSYPDTIHNVVGGLGVIIDGYGSSAGQPLTLIDPNYIPPQSCSIVWHSRTNGWTGGVGKPLTQGDDYKIGLLYCLMAQYWPAHIGWYICD
jgi:uncharacterized protein YmfQ (DUF2313 family)